MLEGGDLEVGRRGASGTGKVLILDLGIDDTHGFTCESSASCSLMLYTFLSAHITFH